MAQKDIQSVLQEDRVFRPTAAFTDRATLKAGELLGMYAKAQHDYVGFWKDLGLAEIDWHRPFTTTLDEARAPNYRWFTDGQLNVSHNCLDVHLRERGAKTAIIFEGEPGDVRKLSYAELHGGSLNVYTEILWSGAARNEYTTLTFRPNQKHESDEVQMPNVMARFTSKASSLEKLRKGQ